MKSDTEIFSIFCKQCKTFIVSRSVHDFRFCSCGSCFIDGGRDYNRFGFTELDDIEQFYIAVKKDKPILSEYPSGIRDDADLRKQYHIISIEQVFVNRSNSDQSANLNKL